MARTRDYMLTERERAVRRAKIRRRWIIGGAAAALMLIAGFGAHPAGSFIKGWQARRHAQRAFEFIEQEKWLDARNEATAAYQLRMTEPDALRAIARFLSRTRQPQALEFWDQLAKVAPLTRTDLRDEAAIALAAGDENRATSAVNELLHDTKAAAPGDWLLAAQLAVRRSAATDAHDALEKVWTHPQASSREKFQAALLENAIAAGHDDWRAEALARVKEVSQGSDAAALDALTVLAQALLTSEKTPDGFPASAADLAKALDAHPLAHAAQKLLAVDLRIHEAPDQKEALIAGAVAQWKNADAPEQAALAAWLNGKGEFQRQLDAIPLERGMQNRELFLQQVDALGALGKWDAIKELLEGERYPLDPVVQKMYLARCNAQLGEKAAAENNWQRALEAARGDPSKLMTLGGYAEKNGATEIAAAAYEEACAEAPKLRAAQQGRLRMAQASGDAKRIHAVLADMLKIWPNDTAVLNDEAYLRLLIAGDTPGASEGKLLASDVDAIEQTAAKLVEKEPASLPHRTLLALVRLRQNRAADALKVYENLTIANAALTPSALAVHAAVLAANGNSTDAETEAKQIPPNTLLREEQALISALVEPPKS